MEETRLIFCLSPGRCGTGYLTRVLRSIPGMSSYHEPKPVFSGQDREVAAVRRFWTEDKLPVIRETSAEIYAETSHVFKMFADGLLDLGYRPGLVRLTRDHRAVALSLWRRRSIPGRSGRGKAFLMEPPAWVDGLNDYQLCYWYCLESERLCDRLMERAWGLGCLIAETSLEKMTTEAGFGRLVSDLELPEPDWTDYKKRRDVVVNANPKNYYKVWPDGDLDEMEQQIMEVIKWQPTMN